MQKSLLIFIEKYRDDPDLQNLVDWVQKDWLKCCGVNDYNDWDRNEYFNCSSPSREACGVPFSCCKVDKSSKYFMTNKQCGYDLRKVSCFLLLSIFCSF